MQEVLEPVSAAAARDELEAAAASLARTPRLEQLLRYIVRRYLDGELEELTEYNIATEVFGRKKTEFIASEDAIVRVETHRLRKKLTAFYETQGRDHAVQISIPLGGYVPLFMERTVAGSGAAKQDPAAAKPALPVDEAAWTAAPVQNAPEQAGPETLKAAATSSRIPWLVLAAVLLLFAAIAGMFALRSPSGPGLRIASTATARASDAGAPGAEAPKPAVTSGRAGNGIAPVSVPFRMIAGYTGAPERDSSGDVWEADHFFDGGWSRHQSKTFIARTANSFLFRYGRDGDMAYNIPLPPGSYELHLYFMQGSDTDQSEDAENKVIFNVEINGILTLKNFDIVSDAMGRNVADERVFRDISPAADGMLHLRLSTVLGTPSLCAIQILPAGSHGQLPIRLVTQQASYTDHNGQLWRPDDYYLGGRSLTHNLPEAITDSDVLPFERYGHFEYALPVDTRDRYTVTLRFVELFFGTQGADLHEDRRLFRVFCNGEMLLDDFDINKEAGSYHVLEKTFHHLKPSAQGKLNFGFEPISNYATVSSIEVVDESR